MIQKIESIEGNWEKPWISVKGRNRFIPENINRREYTGSNKLLLSFVCEISVYKAPIFLTFKQVQEQKLSIKKKVLHHSLYLIIICMQ